MTGNLSRREFVKLFGASATALGLGSQAGMVPSESWAHASSTAPEPAVQLPPEVPPNWEEGLRRKTARKALAPTPGPQPNILYFHIDNLGIGELGCYGGGILRGADTGRIDQFATQGMQLLNFAPEAQCTPTRAALMTGRYSIRSGCATVPFAGQESGLVGWERTMGDVLSDAGYACACYGKWHVGESEGRWPTDHGFDEGYGPIRSYDECLWPTRSEYDPERDPHSPVLEGYKGGEVGIAIDMLTVDVRRDIDLEYLKRAETFIRGNVGQDKPFYVYFNHSMMHMPTIPRKEFEGKSGVGDWADSLLELDADFGSLLDLLDELGIADNTIVVLAGDNGPEETLPWRGTAGYWEGSYFTGMEGSLRSPCLIRWPGHVPQGRESNEIVHVTDMFTTLVGWGGSEIPQDRMIDGVDQRAFFEGMTDESAREGFIFWNGARMYGVKWKDFKIAMVKQEYFWDPVLEYVVPHIHNLKVDPKERDNVAIHYGWVASHAGRMLGEFTESTKHEPPIPAGAPLEFNPYAANTK